MGSLIPAPSEHTPVHSILEDKKKEWPVHHDEVSNTLQDTVEQASGTVSNSANFLENSEAFLGKFGPIGDIASSVFGLLALPLRCYLDKRLPTRQEVGKAAMCLGGVILGGLALASGFGAIALGVVGILSAGISLSKMMQSHTIAKAELKDLEHLAAYKDDLTGEIKKLEDLYASTPPSPVQTADLHAYKTRLVEVTAQCAKDEVPIEELKKQIHHPSLGRFKEIQVRASVGAVATVGALLMIIPFPPVQILGAGLMLGAGVVALALSVGPTIVNWFKKKMAPPHPAPQPAPQVASQVDDHIVKPGEHLQSSLLHQNASDKSFVNAAHLNFESSTKYFTDHPPLHTETSRHFSLTLDAPIATPDLNDAKIQTPEGHLSQSLDSETSTHRHYSVLIAPDKNEHKTMSHLNHQIYDTSTTFDAGTSSALHSRVYSVLQPSANTSEILEEETGSNHP